MSLREKIEGLVRYGVDFDQVRLADVLRVVAEHEKEQAAAKTPPPVGQAGGEHCALADFRAADHEGGPDGQLCVYPVQIPVELIREHSTWESTTGLLVHAIDLCDLQYAQRCFRPWRSSWADVAASAMERARGMRNKVSR